MYLKLRFHMKKKISKYPDIFNKDQNTQNSQSHEDAPPPHGRTKIDTSHKQRRLTKTKATNTKNKKKKSYQGHYKDTDPKRHTAIDKNIEKKINK